MILHFSKIKSYLLYRILLYKGHLLDLQTINSWAYYIMKTFLEIPVKWSIRLGNIWTFRGIYFESVDHFKWQLANDAT
jgi:hypothetical protein